MTCADPCEDDGGNYWDHMRREYLSGVTATTLCQKYGVSLSSFRLHARVGGWRRIDRPDCGVSPEPGEYHPEDRVSFADLADQAFLNIRRALGSGRAAEAASWMRLFDKLSDRARAQVMSDLPDAPPPVPPTQEPPPLRLFVMAEDEDQSNEFNAVDENLSPEREQMDSLHPVFSGSEPPPPPLDRDAILLLRSRRLECGLGVSDLDAALAADAPARPDVDQPANPP